MLFRSEKLKKIAKKGAVPEDEQGHDVENCDDPRCEEPACIRRAMAESDRLYDELRDREME